MRVPPHIKQRIEFLRQEIGRNDYCYYVLDAPKVPDSEYDQLFRELQQYENGYPDTVVPESPTQRVGGVPLKEFSKVEHRLPMLSLNTKMEIPCALQL